MPFAHSQLTLTPLCCVQAFSRSAGARARAVLHVHLYYCEAAFHFIGGLTVTRISNENGRVGSSDCFSTDQPVLAVTWAILLAVFEAREPGSLNTFGNCIEAQTGARDWDDVNVTENQAAGVVEYL